jgi:hypothetical protein
MREMQPECCKIAQKYTDEAQKKSGEKRSFIVSGYNLGQRSDNERKHEHIYKSEKPA